MSASPFTFFRGAALPMAADLAPLTLSGITVQLCGDAHLMNFGLFASPERDLLFDINDFDETLAGAWEWDLMRLSASLVVAARSRSLTDHQARHAVHEAARTYRERMAEYAGDARDRRLLRAGRRTADRRVRETSEPGPTLRDHQRGGPPRRAARTAEDHRLSLTEWRISDTRRSSRTRPR